MKVIPLTKGYVAYVDDEDFDRVNQYKWWVLETGKQVYALHHVHIGPKRYRKEDYQAIEAEFKLKLKELHK